MSSDKDFTQTFVDAVERSPYDDTPLAEVIAKHCCETPGKKVTAFGVGPRHTQNLKTRVMAAIPRLYPNTSLTCENDGDLVIRRAGWPKDSCSIVDFVFPSTSPEVSEDDDDATMADENALAANAVPTRVNGPMKYDFLTADDYQANVTDAVHLCCKEPFRASMKFKNALVHRYAVEHAQRLIAQRYPDAVVVVNDDNDVDDGVRSPSVHVILLVGRPTWPNELRSELRFVFIPESTQRASERARDVAMTDFMTTASAQRDEELTLPTAAMDVDAPKSQVKPPTFEFIKHRTFAFNYDSGGDELKCGADDAVDYCRGAPGRVSFMKFPTAAMGETLRSRVVYAVAKRVHLDVVEPTSNDEIKVYDSSWPVYTHSSIMFIEAHPWANPVTSLSKEEVDGLKARAQEIVATCLSAPGKMCSASFPTLDALTVVSRRVCWLLGSVPHVRIEGSQDQGIRVFREEWLPDGKFSFIFLKHDPTTSSQDLSIEAGLRIAKRAADVNIDAHAFFVASVNELAPRFVDRPSGVSFDAILADKRIPLGAGEVASLLHGNRVRKAGRTFKLVPKDGDTKLITLAHLEMLEGVLGAFEPLYHCHGECHTWHDLVRERE